MKTLKTTGRILLLMVFGGCIGGFLSFLFITSRHNLIVTWFHNIEFFAKKQGILIMVMLLVCIILLFLISNFNRKKWEKREDNLSEQEEDRQIQQITYSIYYWRNAQISFCYILFILSCITYALCIDFDNMQSLFSYTVLLVLSSLFTCMFQIISIRSTQLRDPAKKGDPISLSYDKDWINSLDEAERIIVYKSAYYSNRILELIILTLFFLSMFSKFFLETDNMAIFLLGILWILQVGINFYYTVNINKSKLNQ